MRSRPCLCAKRVGQRVCCRRSRCSSSPWPFWRSVCHARGLESRRGSARRGNPHQAWSRLNRRRWKQHTRTRRGEGWRMDYRSTRCRYGVRINDGASRTSTAARAPYPTNEYPRPVTAPLTTALAGPVYSNTTRPLLATGLRVPRAECSVRNCSRCPPQHDIAVLPFSLRAAPPPRALARRLRASLGAQALSYEPRGDHNVPSRDVRRSNRMAPAESAGQRSSRSAHPLASSRASGAAIQRLRQ